jgi:hypothetical protein
MASQFIRSPMILLGLSLWLFPLFPSSQFLGVPSSHDKEFATGEREALEKAKDAETRLKIYLSIAESRLKDLLMHSRNLDKENSEKAVSGFRAAVTGADECVAKEQAEKNYRRLVTHLHKAVKKYNFTLLQTLEKVAEDFRKHIQSAYEVSQRVQDGAEIQMARFR